MIGIRRKTGIVLHLTAAAAFVMAATSSEPAWILVSLAIGIGLEISAWIAYVLHVEKERNT